MKKKIVLLGLLFSLSTFSMTEYEEIDIIHLPNNMKIVKMLDGENEGLYGIIDRDGKFITNSNNILISVQNNHIYLIDIDSKEGLLTTEGKWIGKVGEYRYKDKYAKMYSQTLKKEKKQFIVYQGLKDKKYGYLDIDGSLIVPIIYEDAENFSQGLAAVKKHGKWGYVDEKGEEVIDFKFDDASDFEEGSALVTVKGRSYYIDKKGKEQFFKTMVKNIEEWYYNLKMNIFSSYEEKIEEKIFR